MMSHFEKFNEELWISRGENFVASLELKHLLDIGYYDIMAWVLTVRERNCVHEKKLAEFILTKQEDWNFSYEFENRPRSVSWVIKLSFDGHLWDKLVDIIDRSKELLKVMCYE